MIRLFVNAPLAKGNEAVLTVEQAHYLRNVMRRAEGDEVLVFNGDDGEYVATLERLGKKERNSAD